MDEDFDLLFDLEEEYAEDVTDNGQLLTLSRNGAHIISPEVSAKLEKKKISPSMITGLNDCAARWLADTYAIPEVIQPGPDSPLTRGTLFHSVMENFFKLRKDERTRENLSIITTNVLKDEKYAEVRKDQTTLKWLKNAINNYYKMGAQPEKVDIAEVKLNGRDKIGLEIFVNGRIGNSSREVLGFVDRITVDPRKNDGSVVVEDWKTGSKAKQWNPNTKSDEGLAEQRQQIIYSMLLEQAGIKVSAAKLIYPVAQEIVKVLLKDKDLRERVTKDVEETDKKLDLMIQNNTFEYSPSFLCAWCPLSKICSSAQIKPYEKMQKAYEQQPDADILDKVIKIM